MSTQRIENPTTDQVQIGDWVEGTWEGHKFAGEVWEGWRAELLVGGLMLRMMDGEWDSDIKLTSLTREAPTLPTKPGTVGRATVRGVPNVRIMRTSDDAWTSWELIDGRVFYPSGEIDASSFVLELEGDGDE